MTATTAIAGDAAKGAALGVAAGAIGGEGPQGGSVTVQAGPEVQNLGEVKPGDKVTISYYQSMAVDVVAPGLRARA